MTFHLVAGILCHLQGGKKKMKEYLMANREKARDSSVNHQYGGSLLRKRRISEGKISLRSSLTITSSRQTSLVKDVPLSSLSKPQQQPLSSSENPDLYRFPSEAYPEYRRMPILLKIFLGLISILLSLSIIMKNSEAHQGVYAIDIKDVFNAFQIIGLYIIVVVIVQDLFYAPSRISSETLMKRRWFPSCLSRFSTISTSIPLELNHDETETSDIDQEIKLNIGVHFLEYKHMQKNKENKIDAIHFMHGFGSSSLTWVPTMRPLVERLDAKVGIAHDGVGFGFTDRPPTRLGTKNDLAPYSSAGWAALGNSLLLDRLQKDHEQSTLKPRSKEGGVDLNFQEKRVVLIGHSMGSAATLKMAFTLPQEVVKVVVLVAPALVSAALGEDNSCGAAKGLSSNKEETKEMTTLAFFLRDLFQRNKRRLGMYIAYMRTIILDPVLMYLLRRGVGTPGFWSTLGHQTMGFTNNLAALGLQWPAIGNDWERGLLAFSRSRVVSACPYAGGEHDLLDDVMELPNLSLFIIHGTNDALVPISMSREIVKDASRNIQLYEMEGLGHSPHEERPEEFMALIEKHLDEAMIGAGAKK